MTSNIEPPRIFATFRYRDAAAAIRWFVDTLGFIERARHHDGDRIAHAELTFGSSIVMLGQSAPDEFGRIVGEPEGQGGRATYVAVEHLDELYRRVEASGVQIDEPPTERAYGSREFTCRDPEGNVWFFGTYWPQANEASDQAVHAGGRHCPADQGKPPRWRPRV